MALSKGSIVALVIYLVALVLTIVSLNVPWATLSLSLSGFDNIKWPPGWPTMPIPTTPDPMPNIPSSIDAYITNSNTAEGKATYAFLILLILFLAATGLTLLISNQIYNFAGIALLVISIVTMSLSINNIVNLKNAGDRIKIDSGSILAVVASGLVVLFQLFKLGVFM